MVEFSRLDTPDAPYYSAWESSSSSRSPSVTETFYIFNCTNPLDVITLGVAPILEEVGPFVFSAEHQNWNVEWDPTQDSISFGTWRWLIEQTDSSSSSSLPVSTQIWTLNFPLIVLIAHGYGSFEAKSGIHMNGYAAPTHGGNIYEGGGGGGGEGGLPTISIKVKQLLSGKCSSRNSSRNSNSRSSSISDESTTPSIRKRENTYQNSPKTNQSSSSTSSSSSSLSTSSSLYSSLFSSSLVQDEFGCWFTPQELEAVQYLRKVLSSSSQGVVKSDLDLFVQKSAYEILFGYADPIFFALHLLDESFPEVYPGLVGNVSSIEESQASSGTTSMRIGDSFDSFTVTSWDGMDSMLCCSVGPCGPKSFNSKAHSAWASPLANVIGGSSGKPGFRHFDPNNPPHIDLFAEQLFRRVGLVPTQSLTLHDDIPVWRYELDPTLFLNSTYYPENAMYYSPDSINGLFNLSSCSVGSAQVFMSKPFFLDGDEALWVNVSLPPPDQDKHNTHFEVEANTGAIITSAWRTQFNVQLQAGDDVGHKMIDSYFVPLLWKDVRSTISDIWIEDFRARILTLQKSADLLEKIGIAFAVIFAVLSISMAALGRWRLLKSRAEDLDTKIVTLLSTNNSDDDDGLLIHHNDGYGLDI